MARNLRPLSPPKSALKRGRDEEEGNRTDEPARKVMKLSLGGDM